MPIRVKQLGRVANQVINGFLQNGFFPSVQSVILQVVAAFNGRSAGAPRSTFTPVLPNTTTNPGTMTTTASLVAEDIQNLYDESIDQVNRIVRDFDVKTTTRRRLSQRIIQISDRLQGATSNVPYQIRNSIDSISNIDLTNTTAFMNFSDYAVQLPSVSNRTAKIDLSDVSLDWSVSTSSFQEFGSVNQLKSDSLNTAFYVRGTDTSNGSASLSLVVTLPQSQLISRITLVGHVSAPTNVLLSVDGEQMATKQISLSRRATWEFQGRQVTQLTFTLSKNTSDSVSGSLYNYDFGIQNIGLFYEEFTSSAVLQTVPLNFDGQPIGSFTLDAQQETPGNCAINWSYSATGSAGTFLPLTPGVAKQYTNLTIVDQKSVLPLLSLNEFPRIYARDDLGNVQYGITLDGDMPLVQPLLAGNLHPLFALCRVNNGILDGDTTIMRGRNYWKVRSYHYRAIQSSFEQDPPPTLADFADPRGDNPKIYWRYQPTEFDFSSQYAVGSLLTLQQISALRLPFIEYPFMNEEDRVMHLFEAYLFTTNSPTPQQLQALNSTTIALPSIFNSPRSSIYLNGQHLPVVTTQQNGQAVPSVVLPIQPGKNVLQIVSNNYGNLMQQVTGGLTPSIFDVGINSYGTQFQTFTSLCAPGGPLIWYADEGSMTEVSLFELQFQTARNDFSRFAIADDPSSSTPARVVIVRELPTCRYDVTTTSINSANVPNSLVLRAKLSGDPSTVTITPKISSYTLSMRYVQ